MQFGRVPETFGSVTSVLTTAMNFPPSVKSTSSMIVDSEGVSQKIIIKDTPKKLRSPKVSFLFLQQTGRRF